jgi:hypothetical protein
MLARFGKSRRSWRESMGPALGTEIVLFARLYFSDGAGRPNLGKA